MYSLTGPWGGAKPEYQCLILNYTETLIVGSKTAV